MNRVLGNSLDDHPRYDQGISLEDAHLYCPSCSIHDLRCTCGMQGPFCGNSKHLVPLNGYYEGPLKFEPVSAAHALQTLRVLYLGKVLGSLRRDRVLVFRSGFERTIDFGV